MSKILNFITLGTPAPGVQNLLSGDTVDFEGGTIGDWLPSNVSATASTSSPIGGSYSMVVENTGGGSGTRAEFLYPTILETGESYTLTFDGVLLTGVNYRIAIRNSGTYIDITHNGVTQIQHNFTNTTAENKELTFTALTASMQLFIFCGTEVGHSYKVDNFILTKN